MPASLFEAADVFFNFLKLSMVKWWGPGSCKTIGRFWSRGALTLTLTGGWSAHAQSSVQLPNTHLGTVRGIAYDSLAMKPLAGVQVQLAGTGLATITDSKGRFEILEAPSGQRQVLVSAVELDSLGFGTIGSEIEIIEGKVTEVVLAPMSLRTIWQRSCYSGNVVGSDSGVVWGTVLDAATGHVPTGAHVEFDWFDLRKGQLLGSIISEVRRSVPTNAAGVYFACGLPTHVALSSTGLSDSAASGRIEFELRDRSLQRLDLTLSVEMVLSGNQRYQSAEDSTRAERVRGTASLRGQILNDRDGPIRDAIVVVVATDSVVRTDSRGRFTLSDLPAGTHNLSVRRIGQLPVLQTVALRPDDITNVEVRMSSLTTLTAVNVRVERSKSKLRQDYEQRRQSTLGRAVDGSVIEKRANLYSIFRDFPHLNVRQNGFGLAIEVSGAFGRKGCSPDAFLDGFPVEMELASSLPTNLYRAIELYENPFTVPAEYITRKSLACGAILFWTKRISW